jgi:hypothetical protein
MYFIITCHKKLKNFHDEFTPFYLNYGTQVPNVGAKKDLIKNVKKGK